MMNRDSIQTLTNFLGELADELASGEYIEETSEIVDCAVRIIEYLRERS